MSRSLERRSGALQPKGEADDVAETRDVTVLLEVTMCEHWRTQRRPRGSPRHLIFRIFFELHVCSLYKSTVQALLPTH